MNKNSYLQSVNGSLASPYVIHGEDPARILQILLAHLARPLGKQKIRVQLLAEAVALLLQFLAIHVSLPTLSQNGLNSPHIRLQLPLDLLGPDHGSRHGRNVPDLAHAVALALDVLGLSLNERASKH